MKLMSRWIAMLTLAVFATATFAPAAMADTRQRKKNEWRNITAGAGAATVYGLTRRDKTLTIAGAVGTAYAAKRYEDERRAQSREKAARARYYRSNSARRHYHKGYWHTHSNGKRHWHKGYWHSARH